MANEGMEITQSLPCLRSNSSCASWICLMRSARSGGVREGRRCASRVAERRLREESPFLSSFSALASFLAFFASALAFSLAFFSMSLAFFSSALRFFMPIFFAALVYHLSFFHGSSGFLSGGPPRSGMCSLLFFSFLSSSEEVILSLSLLCHFLNFCFV